MDQLKNYIKEIAYSNETYKNISLIAEKYNLMLDLQDELAAEIQDVIMGFTHANDFQNNISKRLEIDNELSSKIVADVNMLILKPIQSKIQNKQQSSVDNQSLSDSTKPLSVPTPPPTPQPIPKQDFGPSKLEQIGQFNLEPQPPASNSPQYNDSKLDREAILKEIEDAQHPTMIDHLLATPINNTQKVEEKKVVEEVVEQKKVTVDKKENQQAKPYTVDPYREPIA